MRIAALGNLGDNTPQRRPINGREAVRVAGHIVLQAAFLAPGLALFGVKGWRLLGASIGGSASFTVLSWLWAYANGFKLTPLASTTDEVVGVPADSPEVAPLDGWSMRAPQRRVKPRGALGTTPHGITIIDV